MEDGQRKAYDRLLNERDKEAEIARAEEKFIREIVVIIKMQSSKTSFCYYLSLTDEWVKVTKHGSLSVSFGGWKIEDEGGKHTYTFPSYTLNAGTNVTVYTGKGTNSVTELYWGSSSPIWNNHGDTAYLYDNSGKIVSTLER